MMTWTKAKIAATVVAAAMIGGAGGLWTINNALAQNKNAGSSAPAAASENKPKPKRTGMTLAKAPPVVVATTPRGICALAFVSADNADQPLLELRRRWPGASLQEDADATRDAARTAFGGGQAVSLFLKGTNFQIRVWEALLRIPPGSVSTYEEIAAAIGSNGATRAVGSAIGRNPVAYLIPCHRVIGSDGSTYSRRGNTVTGSDGHRFEIQGKTTYGTDGSVCRTRGKLVDCH